MGSALPGTTLFMRGDDDAGSHCADILKELTIDPARLAKPDALGITTPAEAMADLAVARGSGASFLRCRQSLLQIGDQVFLVLNAD
jgi:hypothetical protein